MNTKTHRIKSAIAGRQNRLRIGHLATQIERHGYPSTSGQTDWKSPQPVVFFNASTRLTGLSQNAAFSLLTSWSLRLAGVPVKHFVCRSGMSHCILGTNRQDHHVPPPCHTCIAQSERLYKGADAHWFEFKPDPNLAQALQDLSIDQLCNFEYNFAGHPIPLGRIVLPSLRWALRRHTLIPDTLNASEAEATRYLLRQYILSAYSIACEFETFLDKTDPVAAMIFNGTMYPEATARWVATLRNLDVITHEVSFQRFSAFFTTGEATAYPIYIPDDFQLSPEQDAQLDSYLENRFQGKFTMAGIRFWPEMRGLDDDFLEKASRFKFLIPIFTNVIYDTSQVHANQVFPHMFAWLDAILALIRENPDCLFVIRAHPDEMRPGTAKQSRESVRDWVANNHLNDLDNVIFIDSQEYISSYELIQRAKYVLVYNSSIGLEASLMGAAVLCGGKARYTQYPAVFFPDTPQAYIDTARAFLAADPEIPVEFQINARRFLYYQLYRTSIPFDGYLQDGPRMGFVQLRAFPWQDLLPKKFVPGRLILEYLKQVSTQDGLEKIPSGVYTFEL